MRRAGARRTRGGKGFTIPPAVWPWLMLVVGLVLGWSAYRIYLREPPPHPAPQAPVIPPPQRGPIARPPYAFYTMLPEYESVVPRATGTGHATAPAATPRGIHYVLQAASFPSYADADALKARLALHGLEAHIQKVTISGRGVYYRVRLGPYASLMTMDHAEQALAALHVSALRLAVRGLPGKH